MASKCTKCGNTDNYNFALNIGLCDICIGEELEKIKELEIENKKLNKLNNTIAIELDILKKWQEKLCSLEENQHISAEGKEWIYSIRLDEFILFKAKNKLEVFEHTFELLKRKFWERALEGGKMI